MAAYGYVRVSTEEQQDGVSLDEQRRKIVAQAIIAGLPEPMIFEDVVSGSTPLEHRKGGGDLLRRLNAGDSLIVAKLDRMFRNATDALSKADEFKQRGIHLYLMDMGGDAVTNNGVSRMFFGVLALVAEFERERLKERLAMGREGKRAKGGHTGGNRPFGYRVIGQGQDAMLVENPDEISAIATIECLAAQGMSLRGISSHMAGLGVSISHQGVKRLLARNGAQKPC